MGGSEEIVKLLLNKFGEIPKDKENLIDFVMKENENKNTVLHLASSEAQKEIVKNLLKAFGTDKTDNKKLIEFVMKENEFKQTALHYASRKGDEEIINSLLNIFDKKEGVEKLIEFLMKKNMNNETCLHYAANNKHENIVKLLSQKLTNAINQKILRDLQKVTQMFKNHKIIYMDEKKTLFASIIFDDECCRPGKEKILSFLITDYDSEKHKIQDETNIQKRKRKKTYNENTSSYFD